MHLDGLAFDELIGISKQAVQTFVQLRSSYLLSKIGRPSILSPCDEVLLILLHLRHFPVDCFLAVIMQQSKGTIFEWRLDNSVQLHHTRYTFVIDGSEQEVSSSMNPYLDGEFYSSAESGIPN